MKTNWALYRELELLPETAMIAGETFPLGEPTVLEVWLHQIWRSLVKALTEKPKVEIWQSVDHLGNNWWNAYDPATGETFYFDSDDEVRTWLEQSYYR